MKSLLCLPFLLGLLGCSNEGGASAVALEARTAALADLAAWEAKQAELPEDQRPHELKGDRLGMRLEWFKAKHYREVNGIKGVTGPAPFVLAGHGGVVSVVTVHHMEIARDASLRQTLAGVPVELMYEFVDGRLANASTILDRHDFPVLEDAMDAKLGEPNYLVRPKSAATSGFGSLPRETIWKNDVSTVLLMERPPHADGKSVLWLLHTELTAQGTRNQLNADNPGAADGL